MIKSLKLGIILTVTFVSTQALSATRDACSRMQSQCLQSAENFEESCNRRCSGNFDCESKCGDRASSRIDSCGDSFRSCNRAADQESDAWDDLNRRANSGTIGRFGTDPSQDGWRDWNNIMRSRR